MNSTNTPLDLLWTNNTKRLIVYDILGQYQSDRRHLNIPYCEQLRSRAKKAFLFSRPGDLILCPGTMDSEHLSWLQKFGFGLGDVMELPSASSRPRESFLESLLTDDSGFRQLAAQANVRGITEILTFCVGPNERALSQRLDLPFCWNSPASTIAEQMDKIRFKQVASRLGLPSIPGFALQKAHPDTSSYTYWLNSLGELMEHTEDAGRIIARPANSAGGNGILIFDSVDEQVAYRDICNSNSADWLIEHFYQNCRSFNLQLFISHPNQYQLLGISEQILSGLSYNGSRSISQTDINSTWAADMMDQANIIARHISQSRYQGIIGLDFILDLDGQIKVVENNIRINASTYPLIYARSMEQTTQQRLAWSYEKMKIESSMSFSQVIDCTNDILIKFNGTNGAFIQEFAADKYQTELTMIFTAESESSLKQLKNSFAHRLSLSKNKLKSA